LIFLIPPSESKQAGTDNSPSSLSFAALADARVLVQNALVAISQDPAAAKTALKLGPKQSGELEINLALNKPKARPAIDLYTGVLYDALKLDGLDKAQRNRAKKLVFIQSSLFGLISSLDEIPSYRLSAGSKLPGINLRSIWSVAHQEVWESFRSETVIDLRSKAYAQLAPLPRWVESHEVEVVAEDGSGVRKALNHFNKRAKGSFIRAVLTSQVAPTKISDLKKVAKLAGLRLETQGKTLLLVTNA
jgi:cytoplasmic iron level regulating protein YaaA (DUF328/UPF0246 family)